MILSRPAVSAPRISRPHTKIRSIAAPSPTVVAWARPSAAESSQSSPDFLVDSPDSTPAALVA